jgi:hypothetical protein
MKKTLLALFFVPLISIQASLWMEAGQLQSDRIDITPSPKNIVLDCPPGATPQCDPPPSNSQQVNLSTRVRGRNSRSLLHSYMVTGGRITGEGANVTWDLTGVEPGTYTVTVEIAGVGFKSADVEVQRCASCVLPCPTVSVACPDSKEDNDTETITFTANVSGGDPNVSATYNWSVSAGAIESGQGTATITVKTKGLAGKTVTATVNVGGYPPECNTTGSCTTTVTVRPIPTPR